MSATPSRSVSDQLAGFLRPAFFARLAVAYLAVGALILVCEPLLGAIVARGARDLVLLTSAMAYLDELAWGGEAFRVTTHLMSGHLSIDARAYWFMVGFPVGFAAALPGLASRAGVRRVLLALGVSLAAAAVMLALTADGQLLERFAGVQLHVNPPWRDMLVQKTVRRFWDLAALMYPFGACLALAWSALDEATPPRRERAFTRRSAALVVAAGLVLLAADRAADLRHVASRAELIPALQAANPQLGRIFLAQGRRLEQRGRLEDALRAYRLAEAYPGYQQRARAGRARVEARLRRQEGGP